MLLRLKRHQLNETVKGCSPFWTQVLSAPFLSCIRSCVHYAFKYGLQFALLFSWLSSFEF